MKTKRLSHAVLMYREEILIIEFSPDKEIDLEQAKEQINAALELTAGKPTAVIVVDEHQSTTVTPEAREFFAKGEHSKGRISEGIVITNLAKRLVANFYIRFHKPGNPARVFSGFNEAWKWSVAQRDAYKAKRA
jgi:Fe-S oxidoreductase